MNTEEKKAKDREYSRKYYNKNKEKRCNKAKENYYKNREKIKKRSMRRYLEKFDLWFLLIRVIKICKSIKHKRECLNIGKEVLKADNNTQDSIRNRLINIHFEIKDELHDKKE